MSYPRCYCCSNLKIQGPNLLFIWCSELQGSSLPCSTIYNNVCASIFCFFVNCGANCGLLFGKLGVTGKHPICRFKIIRNLNIAFTKPRNILLKKDLSCLVKRTSVQWPSIFSLRYYNCYASFVVLVSFSLQSYISYSYKAVDSESLFFLTDFGTNLAPELKIIYIHFSIVAISSQAVNHLSVSHATEKMCCCSKSGFVFCPPGR